MVNSTGLADFTQFGSHRLDVLVCHSVHSYMIYTEPVSWYAKRPKNGGWKKLLSYKFEDLEYPGICVCVCVSQTLFQREVNLCLESVHDVHAGGHRKPIELCPTKLSMVSSGYQG